MLRVANALSVIALGTYGNRATLRDNKGDGNDGAS
jgi:hypothetical protein